MNATPTDFLCMSCMNYSFFLPVFVNWVSYFFTKNFISMRSTPLPEFTLLALLFVFSSSLVSMLLVSAVICLFLSKGSSWSSVSTLQSCTTYSCSILNIFSCDVISGSYSFLVINLLIGRDLIAWLTMTIWWVVIFLFLFSILFLLRVSFLFIISCDIIVVITVAEWFKIIVWISNRHVIIFGLVHDWDYWYPLKNWVPLGHLWLFHFVSSNLPFVLPSSLLVPQSICTHVAVSL